MDIDRYLARLSYEGSRDPTLETLRALHRAHLLAVPFENLSIHAGEEIQLDECWLFDKIVGRRRGGFCYELNGLFAALLCSLGFTVDRLEARVFDTDDTLGVRFDHLALRVRLDRNYLADVGFGDCFVEPLPLASGDWADGRRAYRVRAIDDGFILDGHREGRWKPQYQLSLTPHELTDFAPGCHHHQTSPASPFTRRRVCSRMTETGRLSIADGKRIVTHADGTRTETTIDEDAFRDLLAIDFGIVL